jgi:hypothetical protein
MKKSLYFHLKITKMIFSLIYVTKGFSKNLKWQTKQNVGFFQKFGQNIFKNKFVRHFVFLFKECNEKIVFEELSFL